MAVLLKLHINPSVTITRLEISQVVGLGLRLPRLLLGAGLASVDLTGLARLDTFSFQA